MGIYNSLDIKFDLEENLENMESEIKKYFKFLDGYYGRDEFAMPNPKIGPLFVQGIYIFKKIKSIKLFDSNNFSYQKIISEANKNLIVCRDKDNTSFITRYFIAENIISDSIFIQVEFIDDSYFSKKLRKTNTLLSLGFSVELIFQENQLYHALASNKKLTPKVNDQIIIDSNQSLQIIITELNSKLNYLISYCDHLYASFKGEYDITKGLSALESLLLDTIFYVVGFAFGLTEFKFISGLALSIIKQSIKSNAESNYFQVTPLSLKTLEFNHLRAQILINDQIKNMIIEKYFQDSNQDYGYYSIYQDINIISFTNDIKYQTLSEFKLFKLFCKNMLAWYYNGLSATNGWFSSIDFTKNDSFQTYERQYFLKRDNNLSAQYFLIFNSSFLITPNRIPESGSIQSELIKFQNNNLINPNIVFKEWNLPILKAN